MIRRISKLKTGLYIIPILQVFVMALSVYFAFDLSVNGYVTHLAEQNIGARFAVLNAYYEDSAYDGYYDESSDFIITVHHMIFDDSGTLLYPTSPWESEEEKVRTEQISACYANGALNLKEQQGEKLRIGDRTWFLMRRTYVGEFDGVFVIKNGSEQKYSILAYIDITLIADFLQMLTHVLFILILGFSLVTSALLLFTGSRLDRSFQMLKTYILHVGERKELSCVNSFPYTELNEIADTVFRMAKMLGEAEAAQVKFFQNASHELRTPLTAIRGYAEGLHEGVLRDTKASAAIIMAQSDKMSTLVDDLLYTSRLDVICEAVADETFDLQETLGRCTWAIAGKAANTGVQIDLRMGKDPVPLWGREEMIERALSNVLTNALRYARTEIIISLSVVGGKAVVTVEDDGEGIPPEDLPHIFERFYKGRGGITGIGLSITQEAVRLHKGVVTASSERGHTAFTITLPMENA